MRTGPRQRHPQVSQARPATRVRDRVRDGALLLATVARLRRPLLSVVVPVYDVEDYLEECLDSILRQPVRDLEVVLVDDGSTDASGRIADRVARSSPRVRVIHQENAGLGAARNRGVMAARGRFLAFVDSDDTLPDDAYSAMLGTLHETGSDVAVGKAVRDRDGERTVMPLMRRNHERRRLAVTVEEMPEILADVFAWNKVFRRSFWDRAELGFPDRLRYEDQVALTKAFLAARSIDVLRETVYLWRVRDDRSSITQRRHEIDDLRDRLLTKQLSTDMVLARASKEVERVWWSTIIPVDLPLYFRSVPGCSERYWTELRDGFRELWARSPVAFSETTLPVQQRLMGWLVLEDRREQLERLVSFLDERAGDWPVEVADGRVLAVLPGLRDPGAAVPEALYQLAEHELVWEARLVSAEWRPDALRLEGYALIRNAPVAGRPTELSAELRGEGGVVVPIEVEPREEPLAASRGRSGPGQAGAGFTAEVDLGALQSAAGRGQGGVHRWRIQMVRRLDGIERRGPVTGWAKGTVGPAWHPVAQGSARLAVVEGEPVLEVRR